MREGDWKGRI